MWHDLLVVGLVIALLVSFGLSDRTTFGNFWGKGGRAPWPDKWQAKLESWWASHRPKGDR